MCWLDVTALSPKLKAMGAKSPHDAWYKRPLDPVHRLDPLAKAREVGGARICDHEYERYPFQVEQPGEQSLKLARDPSGRSRRKPSRNACWGVTARALDLLAGKSKVRNLDIAIEVLDDDDQARVDGLEDGLEAAELLFRVVVCGEHHR